MNSRDFSTFPLSIEYDVEVDPTLPIAQAPYLPRMEESRKYTLVLDLDETMIHFEDANDDHDNSQGEEIFYMVRPGLNKFLTELSAYYEIVVYTAAL